MQAAAGTMLVLCNMAVRQCEEEFYCRQWQAQCWFCVIWQSGSVRGFIAGSGRHNAGSV